jgi:anti-sigma factor RsiW
MASCDRIRKQLAEYSVGGLGARAEARVERHLDLCSACRAEVAALNRTADLVSQVGLESAPERVWQGVRAQLTPRPARRPRSAARRWVLVAAAAVFVLFGLLLLPGRRAPRPVVVPMAQADEELQQTMHRHLTASESAPLADSAAIGLALGSWEDDS